MLIGFVVNPIAGMGGRVALKGTDSVLEEAVRRGATPVAPARASEFIRSLRCDPEFLTAGGPMGADYLKERKHRVVHSPPPHTTAEDTKTAVKEFLRAGAELIVFVGGDGTARDVVDVAGEDVPVLGVPSGVKMFSSVFALTPSIAAAVVCAFVRGETAIRERDVLDIDEDEYRAGRLAVRLYGHALVPVLEGMVQGGKSPSGPGDDEGYAEFFAENVERDVLYLLGPGSTLQKVARALGVEKTPLGVDAYINGSIVARDVSEREIISLLNEHGRAKIVITPIGGQGFLLGRGNQQFSPEVIRRVGRDNILVVSPEAKLYGLKALYVDTGDPEVDDILRGYIRVLCGYGKYKLMRVL